LKPGPLEEKFDPFLCGKGVFRGLAPFEPSLQKKRKSAFRIAEKPPERFNRSAT